jgi:hypothetical protein
LGQLKLENQDEERSWFGPSFIFGPVGDRAAVEL